MSLEFSRRDALKLGGAAAFLAMASPGSAIKSVMGAEPAQTATPTGLELPETYANGKYTLPKPPYGYDALEPLYSERTLTIHHGKHHAGAVKGLNDTVDKLEQARKANEYGEIKALSRDIAFNGSGHVLHSLFWLSMKPGGGEPSEELSKAMAESFGSVKAAKAQFDAATKAVEGSGWGVLVYEPISRKLLILQAEKHQNLAVWGVVPLLVCDVWEHAYYLQYANDRGSWVDSFMKLANWSFAGQRYAAVRRLMTG